MGFNSIFLASVKQALPFSRVRFKGLGRAGCPFPSPNSARGAPGWDSPVSPAEPRECPQGPSTPGALCTAFKKLYSSFSCAAVSVSPPSATPRPRPTQTPAQLAFWGGFVLFPAGHPNPKLSWLVGPVGPAGPCPWHPDIAVPAPPRVAAQPQLN